MHIFLYIIRLRITSIFANRSLLQIFRWVAKIILILFSIFYGIIFSYFIEFLKIKKAIGVEYLFYYLNITNAVFILLKGFFPQYTPFVDIFIKPYPIKAWVKSISILTYNFLSLFNLLPIIFCVTLFVLSNDYNLHQFVFSLVTILSFYIIERLIKLTIQSNSYYKFVLPFLTIIITIQFVGNYFLLGKAVLNLLLAIVLFLIYFISFYRCYIDYADKNDNPRKVKIITKSFFKKPNAWNNLSKKNTLFNTIIIGMVFKLLIIIVISISVIVKKNYNLINENLIVALICSPLILFNYAFNNLFGYRPQIFLHIAQGYSYLQWLRYYAASIFKLIAIDFLITLTVLCYIHPSVFSFIYLCMIYISSVIYGFFISILLPRKVNSVINFSDFRSNTSPAAGVLLGLFIIVAYYSYDNYLYFAVCFVLLYLIFSLLYFKLLKHNSHELYVNIIEKII